MSILVNSWGIFGSASIGNRQFPANFFLASTVPGIMLAIETGEFVVR
jgi:hypothetical protein